MTRAGFVAVIGAPNAGKSTLTNRMVGAKVSIVTQKVQTTRFPVRGVAIEGDTQIVLVDTPGIFTPRRRLDRAMVRSAWGGTEDADAVVHLVDAAAEIAVNEGKGKAADRRGMADVDTIVEGLQAAGKQVILALNKIDGVKRENLLAISQRLYETGVYSEVFMISAATGAGVEDLSARGAGAKSRVAEAFDARFRCIHGLVGVARRAAVVTGDDEHPERVASETLEGLRDRHQVAH